MPLVVDAPGAGPIPGVSVPHVPPPPVMHRTLRASELYNAPCADVEQRGGAVDSFPVAINATYYIDCLTYKIPDLHRVLAVQFALDSEPKDAVTPQLLFKRPGYDEAWLDPTFPAQEIPAWANSGYYMMRVLPYVSAVVHGVTMQWIDSGYHKSLPVVHTCDASGITWLQQNPMMYRLQGDARGTCTVVFRQTWAAPWVLYADGNSARVLGHIHADGFANGWIVQADGPVSLRLVNVMIYPWAAGMILTIAMVLLAIGLATASRLRAAAIRRASRVPSPA